MHQGRRNGECKENDRYNNGSVCHPLSSVNLTGAVINGLMKKGGEQAQVEHETSYENGHESDGNQGQNGENEELFVVEYDRHGDSPF